MNFQIYITLSQAAPRHQVSLTFWNVLLVIIATVHQRTLWYNVAKSSAVHLRVDLNTAASPP